MSMLPCSLGVFITFGLAASSESGRDLEDTVADVPVLCLLISIGLLDAMETSLVSAAGGGGGRHGSGDFIDKPSHGGKPPCH
jgi:hypothetical protein